MSQVEDRTAPYIGWVKMRASKHYLIGKDIGAATVEGAHPRLS